MESSPKHDKDSHLVKLKTSACASQVQTLGSERYLTSTYEPNGNLKPQTEQKLIEKSYTNKESLDSQDDTIEISVNIDKSTNLNYYEGKTIIEKKIHERTKESIEKMLHEAEDHNQEEQRKQDELIQREIVKIWEQYDTDGNGTLDIKEVKSYIQEKAFVGLDLTEQQIDQICQCLDKDLTGTIEPQEMACFLKFFLKQSNSLKQRIRKNVNNPYPFLNKLDCPETDVSRDIRITSECWKIWIMFDKDQDGHLNFEELSSYLTEMAFKDLKLSSSQIKEIFKSMDIDGKGFIDKEEMSLFLNLLLMQQENVQNLKTIDPFQALQAARRESKAYTLRRMKNNMSTTRQKRQLSVYSKNIVQELNDEYEVSLSQAGTSTNKW